MIEMKKVIVVSALAMAGVFSAQALADRGKTGFYVTGKAGASVVTQTDQRFRQDFGDDVYKYKGGDKNDTVFGAGLAVGYDFYQHYNVPVRTEVEFYTAELQTPIIHWIHGILRWGMVVGKTHRTGSV